MKKLVLERRVVKTRYIKAEKGFYSDLTDLKKNSIYPQVQDLEYIFRRLVAKLAIPSLDSSGNQKGFDSVWVNEDFSEAEIKFYIEVASDDLFSSIESQYLNIKQQELEDIQSVALEVLKIDDYDEEDREACVQAVKTLLDENALVKNLSDIAELNKLGIAQDGRSDMIVNEPALNRFKRIIKDIEFDVSQLDYSAKIKQLGEKECLIEVSDLEGGVREFYIPNNVNNTNYQVLFAALLIGSRSFTVVFDNPEVLVLSKGKQGKVTPVSINMPLSHEEILDILKASFKRSTSQLSLELS